jgi:hypothetical protein
MKFDTHVYSIIYYYNPPSSSVGLHVFIPRNLSVLSGGSNFIDKWHFNIAYIIARLMEFTDVLHVWMRLLKVYSLLAWASRTQLVTSRVINRHFLTLWLQTCTVHIHPHFNILTFPNWLTILIPLLHNRINSQNFKYFVLIGSLT